jgi:cell volume regulation protein A
MPTTTTIESLLVAAALLLLLSTVSSKASGKLGVPALLLFVGIGMLAGSEGPGGIHFDDAWTAQLLGVLALALILFAGGLDTEWATVRPTLQLAMVLSTVGVFLTALSVGWFATLALGFSMLEGMLLGAIVSSTDAAAVFAVLRSRNVSLRGRLQPLLELESGSNDPMAVFLTVGFMRLLANPAASVVDLGPLFAQQMLIGAALGIVMGKAIPVIVNRIRLEYAGLYPVLTLSLVLLTYGTSTAIGGNGFLSVYLAGLLMGSVSFVHKTSLVRFHDGLAWLMQITMFLTLGLLVFPSHLVPVALTSLLVSLFLILVARPLAVFLALAPSSIGFREKVMVSWVGLRGAVPIVLATYPLLAGVPNAETIFNVVFFTVLTSVIVQGTSIVPVARLLGVEAPLRPKRRYPIEAEPLEGVDTDLVEFILPPRAVAAGKRIVELGLPPGSLITLLSRDEQFLVPDGATTLREGDVVLVLTTTAKAKQVGAILTATRPATGDD